MKKLLLASVALSGLAFAAPAHAEIDLEVGGYFKGYGVFVDQDETAGSSVNDFDFVRDTEIHLGGETTLDNGLTVGAHFEFDVDGADADAEIDESYVYFSGNWGRVNFGNEDGAAYLLQVAAPSADSNIDGIRQYVQPVNYATLGAAAPSTATVTSGGIDYDMDPSGKSDKLTYLSPIFSGFQVGASYSPDTDAAGAKSGVGTDDVAGTIGATYELAGRYEGQFQNVGVIVGAGYSHGDLEESTATTDDRQAWNVGLDLDIGPFGVGVIYREDNGGADGAAADDEETFVIGVDYTTGPFKLGASYYDQTNTFAVDGDDTTRYSGGVSYEYGPGMSFRGSIGYIEHEDASAANSDVDATYVTIGTQINF
ncbi:MAG: porin [Alphaproteobacteria bacterium]